MDSSASSKEIIIFVDRYDSLGGIQNWANNFSIDLLSLGFKVHLIALTASPQNSFIEYKRHANLKMTTLIEDGGHQAYSGNIGKLRSIVANLPRPLRNLIDTLIQGWRPAKVNDRGVRRLVEILGRYTDHVIIICTSQIFLEYLMATKMPVGINSSIPIIAQYHNDFNLVARKKRALSQFKRAYDIANKVVFLTEENRALAAKLGISNTVVIENPRPEVPAELDYVNKKKIAVALGRLEKQKSFEYLIRAWVEIANNCSDWELHIYGTGSEEGFLLREISNLGVQKNVFLKGRTDNPLEILGEASMHLISSQNEGWALTISEAASVGTPTISFDSSPGIRAQITSGQNGILVEKNDVGALTKAIASLIEDEGYLEELSANALKDSERFSRDNITRKWINLLKEDIN